MVIHDQNMKHETQIKNYRSLKQGRSNYFNRISIKLTPNKLLNCPPWPKQRWREHTKTLITSHHEAALRRKAKSNFKLQYLNVQVTGLSARPHPVLAWMHTTQDVTITRPHIRMLAGDYQCYAYLAQNRGLDPHCCLCRLQLLHHQPQAEDIFVSYLY